MSSISERIAAGVAEGITSFLSQRRMLAEEQIDELDKVNEELHNAAGELAAHIAARPGIERVALAKLMQETDPITLKAFTKTSAEANLDLVPEFAAWRQRRNELEGMVHYLTGKVAVQTRRADLAIALLQFVAKEA